MFLMVLSLACSGDTPLPTMDEPAVEDIPVVDFDEVTGGVDDPEPAAEQGSEEGSATEEGNPDTPAAEAEPKSGSEAATKADSEKPTVVEEAAEAVEEAVADAVEDVEEAVEEEAPVKPAAKTVRYSLEPKDSSIYVQVFKNPDTTAAGLSHDHVMAAAGWSGSASWNVDDLSQCSIELTLKVNDLVVDPPRLRTAVGYDSELSDNMRGDVRKSMLGKDQLDASTYPEIRFASTRCEEAGDKVLVVGNLTIKGTTKSISTRMTVTASDSSFSALGGFRAKGSDFGIEPYTAMLGALKNQDEMKYTVSVKGNAN